MVTIQRNTNLNGLRDNARRNESQGNACENLFNYFDKLDIENNSPKFTKKYNREKKINRRNAPKSLMSQMYQRMKKKYSNHVYCDVEEDLHYQELKLYGKVDKLPNCKDKYGIYYYSNKVFVDNTLEYIPPHKLPPKVISNYRCNIQLGVEYSSNNAGDGPWTKPVVSGDAMDFVEAAACLALGLIRAKDKVDYALAFVNFAKSRRSGPLIDVDTVVDQCMSYINYLFEGDELRLQSSNVFADLRDKVKDFESMRKSDLYKKFYKLFMYVISFSIFGDKSMSFTSFGYTVLEKEALKRQFSSRTDFVATLFDTATFLCEKGYQIYKTGEVNNIFHDTRRYEEWYNKSQKLQHVSKFIDTDPSFNLSEFLHDLDECIEQGNSIVKFGISMGRYEKDTILNYLNALKMIRANILTKQRAREPRDPPFSILLYGETGIGKSMLKEIFRSHYANIRGLSKAPEYCYTRNPTAEFWDGFETSQWCLVLDDIAFKNTNICPQGDQSCMEFIQILNPTPFCPNQASLEKKDNTPLLCELVIGTTNCKHLNSFYYFNYPSATQRRFPYIITGYVRPEYCQDGTCMIDFSKVPMVDGEYPDYWLFDVETVMPAMIQPGSKQALGEFKTIKKQIDIFELLDFLTGAVHDHRKKCTIVKETLATVIGIETCEKCYRSLARCSCVVETEVKTCSTCYIAIQNCECAKEAELQSLEIPQNLILFFVQFCINFVCNTICFNIAFYLVYLAMDFFRWWPTIRQNIRCWVGDRFVKNILSNLGKRAYASFSPPKMLAGLAIGITVAYKAFKYSQIFTHLQAKDEPSDTKPVEKTEPRIPVPSTIDTRDAFYFKENYVLSNLDVSRPTMSSNGMTEAQIMTLFGPNCVSLEVNINDKYTRYTKSWCIGGQIYIANNHSIPDVEQLEMVVTQQAGKDGVNSNAKIFLSRKDILRLPNSDVCAFVIRNLPPKKDITKWFVNNSFEANTHCLMLQREASGVLNKIDVQNVHLIKHAQVSSIEERMNVWDGYVDKPTSDGDCGSMLVAKSEMGYCIIGLHMAGDKHRAVSCAISSDEIKVIKDFGEDFLVDISAPILQSGNLIEKVTALHPKSVVRYIPQGTAHVYGSFANSFRQKPKSRVQETFMIDQMLQHGYVSRYTVPVMDWQPWNLAATDTLNITTTVNTSILDNCADEYLRQIYKAMKPSDYDLLHKYDEFTAVNGADGVNYVSKIARDTSAGFPWNRSKKYYIYTIPPAHGLQDPVEITQEIREMMNMYQACYDANSTAAPVFCAHLKDEAVSHKKREMGKTRVFSGANFPWVIIMRKYYLSFIRVMQTCRYVFEGAPGIIAQCSEWEHLYDHITVFGKHKMVCGDFAKFDKKMAAVFILKAFDIIIQICKRSGNYTADDTRAMRCMAYDVAFSYQNYNGDLIQFFGQNPSGHPLTVTINCIVNSLYMRYAYTLANPAKTCATFTEHVHLMTYGDDNIMGISDEAPWFNHTTISHQLSTIGVKYTMADKEAASIPYISIDESSFLKRSFVFDETIGRIVAPLDHDSIEKMLTTWVRSKTITPEEQCLAVFNSAIREYFFYGKAIFEEKRVMFRDVIKALGIERYSTDDTIPTYNQLLEEYLRRSVFADGMGH